MLEQVVFCFLLLTPSMLRKYGFHLFLFGALSKKYDQALHQLLHTTSGRRLPLLGILHAFNVCFIQLLVYLTVIQIIIQYHS
ncbi:hypothetical protein ACS0TY_034076 [Phlomoides rotata]